MDESFRKLSLEDNERILEGKFRPQTLTSLSSLSYFMSFETSGMLFILSFILFAFLFFSVNTPFSLYSGNSLSQPYLGQLLGALVSGLAGRTWTGKVWTLIRVFPTLFLFFCCP